VQEATFSRENIASELIHGTGESEFAICASQVKASALSTAFY
jgi:hypothetical protein